MVRKPASVLVVLLLLGLTTVGFASASLLIAAGVVAAADAAPMISGATDSVLGIATPRVHSDLEVYQRVPEAVRRAAVHRISATNGFT